jgi:ParB family transcriptional regulator, chromosome partitioning protein
MLSLPSQVQDMVEHGVLTSGHARALLALAPNQSAVGLANQAVAQGLSVRQLERLVRELNNRQEAGPQTRAPRHARKPNSVELVDPAVRRIEDDLRRFLQTDVRVHATRDAKGTMEISFYSVEDLDRILDLILGEGRSDF